MAERDEKLAILNGLAGNYAATLSPETAKMWLFLLRQYTTAQTQEAALALIRRYGTDAVPYRTMPAFALMQKELDRVTGAVRGEENVRLQARAEWGKLLADIARCGAYREPDLHPVTAYCVRSFGGWGQVCRWRTEELCWRERDFLQLWEQSCDKEELLALGCAAVRCLDAPQGAGGAEVRTLLARAAARTALPSLRTIESAAETTRLPARKAGPGALSPEAGSGGAAPEAWRGGYAPETGRGGYAPETGLSSELKAQRDALMASRARRCGGQGASCRETGGAATGATPTKAATSRAAQGQETKGEA